MNHLVIGIRAPLKEVFSKLADVTKAHELR